MANRSPDGMKADERHISLRVDVDTFRGTRDGVPALLEALARRGIKATFFFSVGPDNMGRHVRRLLRPKFLGKMLRSGAGGLYGWDILLRGTLWPGPLIGRRLAHVIRAAATEGHEVGLHAWDHHLWQTRLNGLDRGAIREQLVLGVDELAAITGTRPQCSAAAGWQCNERALLEKEALGFAYNSDCRGSSIFRPMVEGRVLAPQIPVTLPTYDELIGRDGVTDLTYNDVLLGLIRPGNLNVLTVHAEVEGCSRQALFAGFLERAGARGIRFGPLRDLLTSMTTYAPDRIVARAIPGRDGTACWQASAVA
ncbi:MAG: 4-deoxy-4-formamido-L-arabinose-phosphoundecaprenol deformylase [Chromatiales bacterium]|nr:4-deoxy-4-formamido-L-arabinose-phosphoundecaprenol deformylase [Chromatiales bacterium]